MGRLLFTTMLFLMFCAKFPAQSRVNFDSLEAVLKKATADTARVRLLNLLASEYHTNNIKKSEDYANKAIALASKTGQKGELAYAYHSMGTVYRIKGEYDNADKYFTRSKEVAIEINDKRKVASATGALGLINYYRGEYDKALIDLEAAAAVFDSLGDKAKLSSVYVNMGLVYSGKSDYENALRCFFSSAALKEKLGDQKGIGGLYSNIGGIYAEQNNTAEAIKYYEKAIQIAEKAGDRKGMARAMSSMSYIFYIRNEYEKAIEYNFRSLEINRSLNDRKGITTALTNLGHVLSKQGRYKEALAYSREALALEESSGDKLGTADTYVLIGVNQKGMKNYPEAIASFEKGLALARELGALDVEKNALEELAGIYSIKQDYKKAYDYYREYTAVKDSLLNAENSKNLARMQAQFESERKDQEITLLSKDKELLNKEKQVQASDIKRQKSILISVISGLVLVSAMTFFIFRGYRQKQRDNMLLESAYKTIEEKNRIVEEKNKDITDSINYARRIQSAILPSMDVIKRALPGSFILYKPKDIVSGDFYWFAEKNGDKLIAAADCTGHGVPGAFMSMIGSDMLNHVVMEKGITSPGDVLTQLNEGVRTALKQDVQGDTTRDGMDIAFVRINGRTIQFAGAYRPLWIIRDNSFEVEEIRADKFPIGGLQSHERKVFTNHTIELSEGDTFYIFSDGYADQFGGTSGKKFMTRKMKDLLLSIRSSAVSEQSSMLDRAIEEWRGNTQQVDDILVIGVRV